MSLVSKGACVHSADARDVDAVEKGDVYFALPSAKPNC